MTKFRMLAGLLLAGVAGNLWGQQSQKPPEAPSAAQQKERPLRSAAFAF